jgi:hypothetical protein
MPRAAVPLALAVLALAACGGESDAENAEGVVREFVEATGEGDTDRLCNELLSPAFIAETTGSKPGDTASCKRALGEAPSLRLRLVEIRRTSVDGDEATVLAVLRVQGRRHPREFRLEKLDGEWKLAGGTSPSG